VSANDLVQEPDPPVRKDGRCAVPSCKQKRTRLHPKTAKRKPEGRYATRDDYARDPFCSSVCCRAYHGVGNSSTCVVCEEDFAPKRSDAQYCSDTCKRDASHQRQQKKKRAYAIPPETT
jgi:hypothetical protein